MNSDRWIDRLRQTDRAALLRRLGDPFPATELWTGVRVTSVALSRDAISAGRYESDAVLDETLARLSLDLDVLLVGE